MISAIPPRRIDGAHDLSELNRNHSAAIGNGSSRTLRRHQLGNGRPQDRRQPALTNQTFLGASDEIGLLQGAEILGGGTRHAFGHSLQNERLETRPR